MRGPTKAHSTDASRRAELTELDPSGSAAHAELPPIEHPYLLLTFIPFYQDADGVVWLDRLWHHDFVEHLVYLRHLIVAAPRYDLAEKPPGVDLVAVEPPDSGRLEWAPIPRMESLSRSLLCLPSTFRSLWRSIGRVNIVHSGVAGWPYPIGWVANPIALARGKKLIVVVESAPWRIGAGQQPSWKDRLRAAITERLARFFCNRADLGLYTQPEYRSSLAPRPRGEGCVTPATWINEENILSEESAQKDWLSKRLEDDTRPRFLFAGRLTEAKGVRLLLEACEELARRRVPAGVDLIGEGEEIDACREAANRLNGDTFELRVLDPVPYGQPFFDLLRHYHAVVIPSLSDEQPRILFDAYSQAVPVIASDTAGLAASVEPERTGCLVKRGDLASLVEALEGCAADTDSLERMGRAAREWVRGRTHRAMHRERWKILLDIFGAR